MRWTKPEPPKEAPFAETVYAVTAGIPEGETLTYQEVAMFAGNPGAARAVGTILSKNYDERIPCHRVVRSDGKMGGYNRGGEAIKLARLRREGAVA